MKYDTTVATDPQSAADCLAHCRATMFEHDYELACAIIGLYAKSERLKAIQEVRTAVQEAFSEDIQ
jgi:hypothetical protein